MKENTSSKVKGAEREAEYVKLKATAEELDRIAKLLIRRDLELSETREKLELSLIELEKKNIELQQKIEEMGTMNQMMVGRELKMIELKKEKEELKSKLKEEQ